MLNLLISIIGILLTILLVVGIHELGHFLVAKWSGIKVIRFAIGFGKPLFSCHDKSGTEYIIAAIPLGGYVKMLDADDNVPASQKRLTFEAQPFYKKFLVIAAGPISNILLSFVIYWCLFVFGFDSIAPVIGKVAPHSIAEQAGLKPQQEIMGVGDKSTHGWMSVIVYLLMHAGDTGTLNLQIKNPVGDVIQDHTLNLSSWHMDNLKPDPLTSIGITPFEPLVPNVIGAVVEGSPAAKSGLKVGDVVTAVNSVKTPDWFKLLDTFVDHPNTTVTFTVKRKHQTLLLPITVGEKHSFFSGSSGYLGISPAFDMPKNLLRHNQYGPIAALGHAWQDVVLFTDMNIIVFEKILTGKISLQSLGGPITIFQNAGAALNNGFMAFFSFLAFLSIAIGIINILPIPGLDGGHLLFQFIEYITGKPLNPKAQLLLYRVGLAFLLLLMVQALVNDILRL